MVKLSEEMIMARTRVSDMAHVKKLNCWGADLVTNTINNFKPKLHLKISSKKCFLTKNWQGVQHRNDVFVKCVPQNIWDFKICLWTNNLLCTNLLILEKVLFMFCFIST